MTPTSRRAAAFFDVDGTLVDANVVDYWIWFSTRGMSPAARKLWLALRLPAFLRFLVLDRMSRAGFNRAFYRGYRRFAPGGLREASGDLFAEYMLPRVHQGGRHRIGEHRGRGERVVLVSGSLDMIVAPLAKALAVDDALTVSLEERAGRFTGELTGPPLAEEEKARAVRAWAEREEVDLAASWAYADDVADLPMLESVGNPVVVNPGRRMRAATAARGWSCVEWSPR